MADTTKINEEIDLTKTADLAPQAAVQPLFNSLESALSILCEKIQVTIIHLKDKLSQIVSEFLLKAKTIADELSTLGAPHSDEDLLIYCTRGLGPAYKEIIAALHSKDDSVLFEELYDKLIDHETYVRDLNNISVHSTVEINATTTRPFSNN
ncbi:Uncharacterized protein Adt_34969 [Abeliophyllum distichum]|uniref:Uncharacterized protein n=1 Tax=Abeliophyllum distichum TaxID=126358 RepID=A0ABD1QF73_9LAMI